jgi:hypothetical protein
MSTTSNTSVPFWSKEAAEIAKSKLERTGLYICSIVSASLCGDDWLLEIATKQ